MGKYEYDSSKYRVCSAYIEVEIEDVEGTTRKISHWYLQEFLEWGAVRRWADFRYCDFRCVGSVVGRYETVTFSTRFEAERALFRYINGDSDIIVG